MSCLLVTNNLIKYLPRRPKLREDRYVMVFYQSRNSQYLFDKRFNNFKINSVTVSVLSFPELSKRKQSFLVLMKSVRINK